MMRRRVLVIPGLAVRGYAEQAVRALSDAGYDATLLSPPSWRGVECDLAAYGRQLARTVDADGDPVSVLVGLSVGTQAAVVAAQASARIKRLLLVSPTVDTAIRTRTRLLSAWLFRGEPGGPSLLFDQLPDWARAGPARILRGFNAALEIDVNQLLSAVTAEVTIVHGELDPITSHAYAARLAAEHTSRFVLVPSGPHSWPTDDAARFVSLVDRMCDD